MVDEPRPERRDVPVPRIRGDRLRVMATIAGLSAGTTVFLLSLLDWGTDLGRRANPLGYGSNFFDLQASRLLDGHLDVPVGSLGIEGFRIDGKEYMYFQPFPALLRMPILFVSEEPYGQLTAASMLLAFIVFATMAVRFVWLVRDLFSPETPVTWGEALWLAGLLAMVTGGTTLTFIASLPWVYHEVYAWAVALAVGSAYWLTRTCLQPTRATIGWLAVFNLALVLTRTTGGWAICITTVAVGAALWWRTRREPGLDRRAVAATLAGMLALAAGVAVNWVKFSHPFMFPLEDQVWTAVNEHRREALEANGGAITGLQFFPTALAAYFRPDGIRFTEWFPWISLPARPARAYAGAFVDQSYRTASVTAQMPWLLLTTALAIPVLLWRKVPAGARGLLFPLFGTVLITGGVMAYGYFAHRYTAEFVPALVIGGTIGTVALGVWVRRRRRAIRLAALGVLAIATAYSLSAQLLIGHYTAAITSAGNDAAGYVALQSKLTPKSQEQLVFRGDGLPLGGETDQMWINGDCAELYLNTGDAYDPWLLVERRAALVEVIIRRKAQTGNYRVATISTKEPSSVRLEYDRRTSRARIQLVSADGEQNGAWFKMLKPRRVRIGVREIPGTGLAAVSSNPGGGVGYLPAAEWDEEWHKRLVEITPLVTTTPRHIEAKEVPGLDPQVCTELVERTAGE